MTSRIITIVVIVLLALVLIGGSAYILFRPTNAGESERDTPVDESTGAANGGDEEEATSEGAEHPLETWTTITVTVVLLDAGELTVEGDAGQFVVDLGPEWYWETNGIPLNAGDEVALVGFDEDGTFQVTRVVDLTTGQAVPLRDETGRPLWAGQGRGGG